MTTWAGRKVSAFALGAGFTQSELPLATAVAWAASKGADHYVYNAGLTISSERRGLWALRVDEVPDGEAHLLWNPDYSARTARRLFVERGASWLWHPAVLSGQVDSALPLVTAVINGDVETETDTPQANWHDQLRRMVSLRSQIANTAIRKLP
jgi:hypothetical protein